MKRLLFQGGRAFQVFRWPADDRPTLGVGGVFTREAESQQEDSRASTMPETVSNWFKLQVLDDETGKPVAGVPIELRLPGQEPKEFTTDGQGKIQLKDLPDGVADIIRVNDSEAYEVVSLE